MAQRKSGYARKARDLYQTPAWVTELLLPHIDTNIDTVWEPACAEGKIMRVLENAGYVVYGSDLVTGGEKTHVESDFVTSGVDFLEAEVPGGCRAIITNPPFNKAAEAFIRKCIRHIDEGKISYFAMLLPLDFDSAKTRRDMFEDCPYWYKKLVLTRRILWFKNPDPKKNSPSQNHAWFVWNSDQNRGAIIKYLFSDGSNSDVN